MAEAVRLIKTAIGVYEFLRRNCVDVTDDEIVECALWLHMRRSLSERGASAEVDESISMRQRPPT